MPSLNNRSDRHVTIDERPGQYLCFPDVCLAHNGDLLVAYNEYEKHVGERRRLLLRTSSDLGATWDGPRLLRSDTSHCPRLSTLSDGLVTLIDEMACRLYLSADHGKNWTWHTIGGLKHAIPDRLLELDFETLLTTGHRHRGTHPHPAIRQAPAEQMAYISEDRGQTFRELSVMANDRNLVLCEASMCALPGGLVVAIMRENSFVFEPMYITVSRDGGKTWADPKPTPLMGHRPTIGVTPNGKLLITYRNVAPDAGTAAWLGDLTELDDFRPHGIFPQHALDMEEKGLHIRTEDAQIARFALRPLTDPRSARATLEATLAIREAGPAGFGLRLGGWWNFTPKAVLPPSKDAPSIPLKKDETHRIRIEYANGECCLLLDDSPRLTVPVKADRAETRPILVGTPPEPDSAPVDCTLSRLALRTEEPRYLRSYEWEWTPEQGLPDQWMRNNVLELRNARGANLADFGYSGWTALPDGRFFCVYHHADGEAPDYKPGYSSRVEGTFFEESDFGK